MKNNASAECDSSFAKVLQLASALPDGLKSTIIRPAVTVAVTSFMVHTVTMARPGSVESAELMRQALGDVAYEELSNHAPPTSAQSGFDLPIRAALDVATEEPSTASTFDSIKTSLKHHLVTDQTPAIFPEYVRLAQQELWAHLAEETPLSKGLSERPGRLLRAVLQHDISVSGKSILYAMLLKDHFSVEGVGTLLPILSESAQGREVELIILSSATREELANRLLGPSVVAQWELLRSDPMDFDALKTVAASEDLLREQSLSVAVDTPHIQQNPDPFDFKF